MSKATKSCWGATHGQNVEIIKALASINAPSFIVKTAEKLNKPKPKKL